MLVLQVEMCLHLEPTDCSEDLADRYSGSVVSALISFHPVRLDRPPTSQAPTFLLEVKAGLPQSWGQWGEKPSVDDVVSNVKENLEVISTVNFYELQCWSSLELSLHVS